MNNIRNLIIKIRNRIFELRKEMIMPNADAKDIKRKIDNLETHLEELKKGIDK